MKNRPKHTTMHIPEKQIGTHYKYTFTGLGLEKNKKMAGVYNFLVYRRLYVHHKEMLFLLAACIYTNYTPAMFCFCYAQTRWWCIYGVPNKHDISICSYLNDFVLWCLTSVTGRGGCSRRQRGLFAFEPGAIPIYFGAGRGPFEPLGSVPGLFGRSGIRNAFFCFRAD